MKLVAFVGNAVKRMFVTVPPVDGSLAAKVVAGTVILFLPPGLFCGATELLTGTGGCSMPKLAFVIAVAATVTGSEPFGVPSLPAAVPMFSPVLTQPLGRIEVVEVVLVEITTV